MSIGLKKGLEDIAAELKGIRNILATMWHSRYQDGETDMISPEVYADEYISTEECARRLNVSDQTIRNWILTGKKDPNKGWTYGIHYINIGKADDRKQIIRIPWNNLIQSFIHNTKVSPDTFKKGSVPLYNSRLRERKDNHVPNPSVEKTLDFEEGLIQGY
jgi:hypothetical protein